MKTDRRVQNLVEEYGNNTTEAYMKRLLNISNKFGTENTKTAKKLLNENKLEEFCSLLLTEYYDKLYLKTF